jgi:hypothetical protein
VRRLAVVAGIAAFTGAACGCGEASHRGHVPSAGRPTRLVVGGGADATSPAGSGSDLVWTRGGVDAPVIVLKLGTVELREGGRRPVRISEPGILSASGGMDRRNVVIQEVRSGQSDLRLYDLRSHSLRSLPPGPNTRSWEWRGSISGRRLLFGRIDFASKTYRIVLANLATGEEQVLDSVSGHGAYAEPGQLAGRYAVWLACPDNVCSIYRYDIRTAQKIQVTKRAAYTTFYYAPSVTADGTVYYAEGARACGAHVSLVQFRPQRATRRIATLPPGYDLRFTSAIPRPGGTRIVFDRVNCSSKHFAVYELRPGIPR